MGAYQISIQPGHIARHTPRNAGAQGREAAVVDIAQDLLLRELQENGTLASVVIKGGTAIRKLYAGNEGRFSLDLDFAVAEGQPEPRRGRVGVRGRRGRPFNRSVLLRHRRAARQVVRDVLQPLRGRTHAADQTRLLPRSVACAR